MARSLNHNPLCVRRTLAYTCSMKANYTAVVKLDAGRWIGWIEELPGVNCQEKTRDELIESLRITLREALELNRSDAIDAASDGFEELEIAV